MGSTIQLSRVRIPVSLLADAPSAPLALALAFVAAPIVGRLLPIGAVAVPSAQDRSGHGVLASDSAQEVR
jgi:hydrogenase/urease accessory protein HupE